jgi:hypothetical protein
MTLDLEARTVGNWSYQSWLPVEDRVNGDPNLPVCQIITEPSRTIQREFLESQGYTRSRLSTDQGPMYINLKCYSQGGFDCADCPMMTQCLNGGMDYNPYCDKAQVVFHYAQNGTTKLVSFEVEAAPGPST